jgi:general secretion pathway protein D
MPTSNLIGRIRFIPVFRSKAILVLSPKEYQESITEMIKTLDQPGKQVMVKAVIVATNHSEMATLGLKLASDTATFGTLTENSLLVETLAQLHYLSVRGSLTLSPLITVQALVDFLIKETSAKVINQPTLWTKDNEEAIFFKGQRVPFIETSSTSTEGRIDNQTFRYENVGVTLRIRPNITPENNVDLTINLIISQVEPEIIAGQVSTSELNTTTHLIVEDGQTIMLGGILFQNESKIQRKLPIIGDAPLIGPLFRHYDTVETTDELLVFITPHVVDANSTPETVEEFKRQKQNAMSPAGTAETHYK